jgi:hypothetical protein
VPTNHVTQTRTDEAGLAVVLAPAGGADSTHPALAVTQTSDGPGVQVVSDSTTSPAVCVSGGTGVAVRATPGARQPVIHLGTDGTLQWGPGTSSTDTSIYRSGTGALTLDADITITGVVTLSGGTTIQRCVWKTADETINNSIALQDDDDLALTVVESTAYTLDAMIINSASTTSDLQLAFTGPAGASLDWVPRGLSTLAAATVGEVTLAASVIGDAGALVTGTAGVGTKTTTLVTGLLRVGATAGTLQLRWAQGTADATDCVVHEGSYMVLRQVS